MVLRPLVGKINIILSNSIIGYKTSNQNFQYAAYVALAIETELFLNTYFTHDLRFKRNRFRIYFQYKCFSIDLANCSLLLFHHIGLCVSVYILFVLNLRYHIDVGLWFEYQYIVWTNRWFIREWQAFNNLINRIRKRIFSQPKFLKEREIRYV